MLSVSASLCFVSLEVYCSQHIAFPFGATSSTHAWERVGAAIAHLARTLLKLPVLRYVDDYFAVGRLAVASLPLLVPFKLFAPGARRSKMQCIVSLDWCALS